MLAWAMIRPFVLPVLLAVAVGGNLWQWRAAAVTAAKQEGADTASELRGRLAATEEYAARASLVATMLQLDYAKLLEDFEGIAERSRERVTVYRTRIGELPPASCPPGAEFMDAVNGVLQ